MTPSNDFISKEKVILNMIFFIENFKIIIGDITSIIIHVKFNLFNYLKNIYDFLMFIFQWNYLDI